MLRLPTTRPQKGVTDGRGDMAAPPGSSTFFLVLVLKAVPGMRRPSAPPLGMALLLNLSFIPPASSGPGSCQDPKP